VGCSAHLTIERIGGCTIDFEKHGSVMSDPAVNLLSHRIFTSGGNIYFITTITIVLRPLIPDNPGELVLSQRKDLVEQPLDFYEPDVLPATQPIVMQCKNEKIKVTLSQKTAAGALYKS